MPCAIAISSGGDIEMRPPMSLIIRHASSLRCVQWMNRSPVAQQAGRAERASPGRGIDAVMHDRGHTGLARDREHLRVEARAKRQRQQLVLRAEIGPLQARDVLRPLHGRTGAARVAVDRADAGILQRVDAGVAVLGRVADLREVDDAVVPMSMKPSAVISTPA